MIRPKDEDIKKLQWLLSRLTRAEDYCRPYFDRAKRHYQLYRFGSAVKDEDWPYVNRTRTRDILAFIEDSTAIMVQNLLGQYPFYGVEARRTSQMMMQYTGLDPAKIGEQMESCLNYQAGHEETEFFDEIVDFFKEGGIFGNSYIAVYPKFDSNNKYAGPLLKTIGFWDVLPIPGARRMSKARGVFVREFMSIEEVQDLAEKSGNKEIVPFIKSLTDKSAESEWHKDMLAELGISNYDTESDDIETIHYFSGGHIITFVGRAYIVRDSRNPETNQLGQQQVVKPFPYDQPVVQYKYMPIPLEFFGMGIPEVLETLQEDRNLIRSARRDNIDLIINKVIKARAGADINYDLIKYYPGAIWPLENLGDIEHFEQGDVTQSSYAEEEKLRFDMENALSFFGYARGMTPTHEERPTTVIKLQQAAMNRLDLAVKLAEFGTLQNIATRIILLTRRYMPQADYEAIIGDKDAGFYKLSEDDIRKFYLFKPLGSSVTHIKEIRQQQIQVASQMLTQVAPMAMSGPQPFSINWYEATREGLKANEMRNVDKILIPINPQIVQQQGMMAEAKQLQQIKYGEDIKTEANIKQIFAQAEADIAVDKATAKPEARGASNG